MIKEVLLESESQIPTEVVAAEKDLRTWPPREKLGVISLDLRGSPTSYAQILEEEGSWKFFQHAANHIIDSTNKVVGWENRLRSRLTEATVGTLGLFRHPDKDKIRQELKHGWDGPRGVDKTVEIAGADGSFGIQAEAIAASENQQDKLQLSIKIAYALAEELYLEGHIRHDTNPFMEILNPAGSGGILIEMVDDQNHLIDPESFQRLASQAWQEQENEFSLPRSPAQKLADAAKIQLFTDLSQNSLREQTRMYGGKYANPIDVFIAQFEGKLSSNGQEKLKRLQSEMNKIAIIADFQPSQRSHIPIRHHAGWNPGHYITTISTRPGLTNQERGINVRLDTHHTETNGLHNRSWLWKSIVNGMNHQYRQHVPDPKIRYSSIKDQSPTKKYNLDDQTTIELMTKHYQYAQLEQAKIKPTLDGQRIIQGYLPQMTPEIRSNWIKAEDITEAEIEQLNQQVLSAGRQLFEESRIRVDGTETSLANLCKKNLVTKLSRDRNKLPLSLQKKFDEQNQPTDELINLYYNAVLKDVFYVSPASLMLFIAEKAFDQTRSPLFTVASREDYVASEISIYSLASQRNTPQALFPPDPRYHPIYNPQRQVIFNPTAAAKFILDNFLSLNNIRNDDGTGYADVSILAMGIGSEGVFSKGLSLLNRKLIGGIPEKIDNAVRRGGGYNTQGTLSSKEREALKLTNKRLSALAGTPVDISKTQFRPPQFYTWNSSAAHDASKGVVLNFRINHHLEDERVNWPGIDAIAHFTCLALQQDLISIDDIANLHLSHKNRFLLTMTRSMKDNPDVGATEAEVQSRIQTVTEALKQIDPDISKRLKTEPKSGLLQTIKNLAQNPGQLFETIKNTFPDKSVLFLQNILQNNPRLFVQILKNNPSLLHNILTNPKIVKALNDSVNLWANQQQQEAIFAIRAYLRGQIYTTTAPPLHP